MEKGATTKCNLPLIPRLLILLSYQWMVLQAESPTLCSSFNISNSVSGLWSYEFQSQVNPGPFHLNRNIKCHVTDALGNRLNATEIYEKPFHSLQDQVYHFKDVLYQMQGENNTIRAKFQMTP